MALIIRLSRCMKVVARGYLGKFVYAEVIFIGGVEWMTARQLEQSTFLMFALQFPLPICFKLDQ